MPPLLLAWQWQLRHITYIYIYIYVYIHIHLYTYERNHAVVSRDMRRPKSTCCDLTSYAVALLSLARDVSIRVYP